MDRIANTPVKVKSLKELDGLPLFFIIGRGRSGSTLLRSMLDAHPSVKIPLESRFVQFLYYNYPAKRPWTTQRAVRALDALESGFEPLKLNWEALREQVEEFADDLSFERVCKLIYLHSRSEFAKGEIRILGDKNPRYTFFIPQLLRLFTGAKFIHLVRDYRDNMVAVQRAARLIRESGNPYFALGRWCLYNRKALKYQDRYPDRLHRVYFEELITEPETVMHKVCTFLELDYHTDMLSYRERMDNYFEEKGFSALHQSLQAPFDPSKIGEWEDQLPERIAIRCEVLSGRLPVKLGYAPRFRVPVWRKAGIKLLFSPVVFLGQIRFLMKILFYRFRLLMRIAYGILLRMK